MNKKYLFGLAIALALFLTSFKPTQAAVTPVFDVTGGYFDDTYQAGAYVEWSVYVYGTKMYLPYTVSMASNCNGLGLGDNRFMKWSINSLSRMQTSQVVSFMVPWNKLKDPIADIPVKITGMKKNQSGVMMPIVLYTGTVKGPVCR